MSDPLSESDVAELAKLFQLLAEFDYRDTKKENYSSVEDAK